MNTSFRFTRHLIVGLLAVPLLGVGVLQPVLNGQSQPTSIDQPVDTATIITSPIGTNMAEVTDYIAQIPFKNVFITTRGWFSQKIGAGWDQGGPLDLDENGWIKSFDTDQYAEVVLLDNASDDSGAHYPGGDYIMLWDGEGDFSISLGSQHARIKSMSPGRAIIEVDTPTPENGANGFFIRFTSTNPANYMRNIRVLLPGTESTYTTQPFNEDFLDNLRSFDSIRFMDWLNTNASPDVLSWSDRNTLTSYTQGNRKGVAWEYIIALANELNIDPWINIPHAADDTYVTNVATLFRDNLEPGLKVHIEYTNEFWNGIFPSASYTQTQGDALGLGTGFLSSVRFYSKRSVEIFDIFENVFGGTDRIVRIMGTQIVNQGVGDNMLSYNDAYLKTDVIAGAPYLYCKGVGHEANKATTLAKTIDQIIQDCEDDIIEGVRPAVQALAELSEIYNVDMMMYEAGIDLAMEITLHDLSIPENQELETKLTAVDRSPKMKSIYYRYFQEMAVQSNGGLIQNFSDIYPPNKYGTWGIKEHLYQDPCTAPKYRGILHYLDDAHNNPWIRINTPLNNGTLTQNDALTAITTDPHCDITKVEFFQESTKLGEDNTQSDGFTLPLTSFPIGQYANVSAVSTDSNGTQVASAAMTFSLLAPPVTEPTPSPEDSPSNPTPETTLPTSKPKSDSLPPIVVNSTPVTNNPSVSSNSSEEVAITPTPEEVSTLETISDESKDIDKSVVPRSNPTPPQTSDIESPEPTPTIDDSSPITPILYGSAGAIVLTLVVAGIRKWLMTI